MFKLVYKRISLLFFLGFINPVFAQEAEIFSAYKQILPRGEIVAVFEPVFVSADEATIADSSWVFGIVLDGQAKAFSINLLNHHEIINDALNDRPFAAVW